MRRRFSRDSANLSCSPRLRCRRAYRAELLALKQPPELTIDAMATYGGIAIPDLGNVTPADIRHIGGKASNFGYLRRAVPDNSPDAIAFTFDLWNAYLDQTIAGGRTLRAEIAARLEPFSWPPDVAALYTALGGIRDLIKDVADFNPAQKADIITALQAAGLDPDKKIRFRQQHQCRGQRSLRRRGAL